MRTANGLFCRAAVVSGAVMAAVAATAGAAVWRWNRDTGRAADALAGPDRPPRRAAVAPSDLAGLPPPVIRYFDFALKPGQARLPYVRIEHTGEFRTAPDAPWAPFRSVEHLAADPPGFVWDASMRLASLVPVRVRDSYRGGRAAMEARIGALLPVVDQENSPTLAAGALHRYLAEAVWMPTALLPASGVIWEPIDDASARATLSDHGVTVSAVFTFGSRGEIVRVFAPDRYRDVDGVGVPTPWAGEHREYAAVDGMQIPLAGEVAWLLPAGRFVYWRGRVSRVEFGAVP